MAEVVGVVDVVAASGKGDALVGAFEACATQTHTEPGCLAYALHQDNADPNHFILVERWRSQDELDDHMTKPWVADLFAFVGTEGNLAAAPALAFTTNIAKGDPAKGTLGG